MLVWLVSLDNPITEWLGTPESMCEVGVPPLNCAWVQPGLRAR
jgi:hypothetical protein